LAVHVALLCPSYFVSLTWFTECQDSCMDKIWGALWRLRRLREYKTSYQLSPLHPTNQSARRSLHIPQQSTMTSNILVLGAGELGMAVMASLAHTAPSTTQISVLLRSSSITNPPPSKAAEHATLRSLNIVLVPGDVATSSIPTLASLFKPYNLIISCLGFACGPGSQVKISQAVLQAGVPRYFPWQFGADYDIIGRGSAQTLFDEQLDVRDLLRSQNGTEWVIVSTGMFTSFLFESYFGVVDLEAHNGRGVVRALGDWENKVTLTTAEDIGKLTAAIVFQEPKFRNEVVYIASDTVSYGQVAEAVDEVLGRQVERELWTVDYLKEELRKDPESALGKYRVVFAEGKGCFWEKDRTFNRKRGIEVEDLRGWMARTFGK